jgi:hypothetical protein
VDAVDVHAGDAGNGGEAGRGGGDILVIKLFHEPWKRARELSEI